MDKIIYSCPVPKGQQPLNEYLNLKNSVDFSWTTEKKKIFVQYIILLTLTLQLVSCTLFFSTQNVSGKFLEGLNITSGTSLVAELLILIRIYLGWMYVYKRLLKATITYEESGWYDGHTWVKTPEIMLQDRLLAIYELEPIINRLRQTIIYLTLIAMIGLYLQEFILQ